MENFSPNSSENQAQKKEKKHIVKEITMLKDSGNHFTEKF